MMRDPAGVIRPDAKRFRGRLGWAVVLGTLLGLGIGCGLQGSRSGGGPGLSGGFSWAAADTSRLLRTAHYFKQIGQPELGAKELEEAHRLDPGNLEVADALAQYYDELGMGARAQQVYRETLALAPDNPALQNNLCFSYYQGGDWSQAETCFRKTLARQPNNQAARNNLGLVLCRQGRREEARRLWQEAESEAVAAQRLGEALAALGLAGEIPYAQATRPRPPAQSISQANPADGGHGTNPVTVAAGPPPSPGASPVVDQKRETAGRAPVLPPAVAAAEVPVTPQLQQSASDSRSREIAAPRMVEDRVSPAPPRSHQPAPGLVAGNLPARPLPPPSDKAPPPSSPLRQTATPARPGSPTLQPVLARQSAPQIVAAKTFVANPPANLRAPITAGELMETAIAILNGNGIHDLARASRSQLSLEGYNVVAINNFRDFGVERTVIYYRSDAARVASILNKQFFPGAELEPASRLADSIDVQVVLGHDLDPRYQAEAAQPHEPRL
ncbi:MAG: LytR C-terminal domain-containing protein [Desulfobaccales bacterium]